MESVGAAAVLAPPDPSAELGSTIRRELVARAAAIARGQRRLHAGSALLPRELRAALQASETRARRVPGGLGRIAALDFLGEAVAAIAVAGGFDPGEARAVVASAADVLGMPLEATVLLVLRRALASRECGQLPPADGIELALALLAELAPAAAASLWALDASGATTCLAAHGKAARSRGMREAARGALDGLVADVGHIRVQSVDRWGRPHAALVARERSGEPSHLDRCLAEAASALAPMLERATALHRKPVGERQAAAAGERLLARLGCDLHDGPLQEIVALAEELRLASTQIGSLVHEEDRGRVAGRFDDLHARLGSLDETLRQIARATRSAAPAAWPVEEALASELEALERASGTATELEIEGDVSELTDSQKIVLFRVVQEAASNIRKHSGARRASVALRGTRRYLDLTVTDDGCGFDLQDRARDRLGLAGISERVRLLGGVVEIESRPGAGTTLRATLPRWRPSVHRPTSLSAVES